MSMKLLHSTPILRDVTSTGKDKFWQGHVAEDAGEVYTFTEFWQGGAVKQMSAPTAVVGKNIGKANETSPQTQAIADISSDMAKKIKKGYVPEGEKKTRTLSLPMLAHTFTKRGHDISWPCDAQPKLDGVRAVTDGRRFWSREGNLFPAKTTEHLRADLVGDVILSLEGVEIDGEVMLPHNGSLGGVEFTFEQTISALKDETPDAAKLRLSRELRYYVFDVIIPGKSWKERRAWLDAFFARPDVPANWKLVPTFTLQAASELDEFMGKCVELGFEGAILRNWTGVYRTKHRSKDLQKHKPFVDDEFEIVGFKEANGKDAGTPVWVCALPNGETFEARPMGSDEYRRKLWQHRKQLLGKKVTVTYQNMSAHGKPRFPVAKAIRDYEN